jgi:hypothetical protein
VLLTTGGALTAVLLLRRELVKAMITIVALMTVSIVTAVLWVLPYLETFKSPRPFALEINRFVPATAPLYIYADTMHDFNYYAGREKIPVVHSLSAVKNLLAAPQRWLVRSALQCRCYALGDRQHRKGACRGIGWIAAHRDRPSLVVEQMIGCRIASFAAYLMDRAGLFPWR